MEQNHISRATLGRLPIYLDYLKTRRSDGFARISAPRIARELGRGEVQVRKDLSAVSNSGKPKIGFVTDELIEDIESVLGPKKRKSAVIVGAGRLGKALLEYEGFELYGIEIPAAFDIAQKEAKVTESGKKILPLDNLAEFCNANGVHIGIITVPASEAQSVCDKLVQAGISAVWNFAPRVLELPEGVALRQENLALSLAHLNMKTEADD